MPTVWREGDGEYGRRVHADVRDEAPAMHVPQRDDLVVAGRRDLPAVVRSVFLADTQAIQSSPAQVVVGQGNWQQQLQTNEQAFALNFVQRPQFAAAYPTTLTPTQFVAALYANTAVAPSASDTSTAAGEFGAASDTSDISARARALRDVAENTAFSSAEFNRAFVLMQYFGYLQRDPDAAPDNNFNGYNFWLSKLDQFQGNYVQAEMVKAFISSTEYRQRFGQP